MFAYMVITEIAGIAMVDFSKKNQKFKAPRFKELQFIVGPE